jgi:ActR/RegA family two-component response regulator
MPRRILFVDDEDSIRVTLAAILKMHGFEVSTAATVAEALQKITSAKFDVLLSDLNIGNPGDGLTVVSAMRRTQPEAVTMILTGYPALETALEAIRQQVDDYIVKPANIPALLSAIESKLATPPRRRQQPPPPKRVAMLLEENVGRIESLWFSSIEKDPELSQASSKTDQRRDYLHNLLKAVIHATRYGLEDETTKRKGSGVRGGSRRDLEGYTPRMVVTEVCLLRRVIAQIVQENLLAVNLSYLIPDLARINETLDEQAQDALAILSESPNVNSEEQRP